MQYTFVFSPQMEKVEDLIDELQRLTQEFSRLDKDGYVIVLKPGKFISYVPNFVGIKVKNNVGCVICCNDPNWGIATDVFRRCFSTHIRYINAYVECLEESINQGYIYLHEFKPEPIEIEIQILQREEFNA